MAMLDNIRYNQSKEWNASGAFTKDGARQWLVQDRRWRGERVRTEHLQISQHPAVRERSDPVNRKSGRQRLRLTEVDTRGGR